MIKDMGRHREIWMPACLVRNECQQYENREEWGYEISMLKDPTSLEPVREPFEMQYWYTDVYIYSPEN